MKIRIHYEAITGEAEAFDEEVKSLRLFVQQANAHGGFYVGKHPHEDFIPFGKLNGIECLDEPEPAPEEKQEPAPEDKTDAAEKGPESEGSQSEHQ